MAWKPLAGDTTEDAERAQIELWAQMTPAEKLALVSRLSQMVTTLAMAGIQQRFPDASPREQFLRFAMLHLEPRLARAAYPEIIELDLQ